MRGACSGKCVRGTAGGGPARAAGACSRLRFLEEVKVRKLRVLGKVADRRKTAEKNRVPPRV